jgi:hypothetical protein
MSERCAVLIYPIRIVLGVNGRGNQVARAKALNSLTWAGCIQDLEGGWPRGACPIALRAG